VTGEIEGCLACDLTAGRRELPGGTILRTEHWAVEHCIGPLGVGTLIVKPLRHVVHFAELAADEIAEFGPLLRRVAEGVLEECQADQTYICQWSHAGWQPGHIHFVVQPAFDREHERYEKPGPFMQVRMFDEGTMWSEDAVESYCRAMRERLKERGAA
jgi:diadenosine tetraphosphate (Ap4A) HIT family hydrolase